MRERYHGNKLHSKIVKESFENVDQYFQLYDIVASYEVVQVVHASQYHEMDYLVEMYHPFVAVEMILNPIDVHNNSL
jgi:hypothetical protein